MPSDTEYELPTPEPPPADRGAAGVDPAADSAVPAVDPAVPAVDAAVPSDGSARPDVAQPVAAEPAKGGEASLWPERAASAAGLTWRWIGQPRVRLATVGVLLLLIGGIVLTNSVWTLPLVVIGALMVVVAWVGRRLEGRVAVEWGESGTEVLFRATIKAPVHDAQLPAPRPAADPAHIGGGPAVASGVEPDAPRRREDVIEGEAHTVEIDVADLKALIAAVETVEADVSESRTAAREFRLHRTAREPRTSESR